MRIGRVTAGLLGTGIAAAGLGSVAAQAQAAVSAPVQCSYWNGSVNTTPGTYNSDIQTAFRAGDVLRITATTATTPALNLQIPSGGGTVASTTVPGAITYTFAADQTTTFSAFVSPAVETEWRVTCTRPATPAIPDWLQAYGIFHQFDTCIDGWSNSWHEWALPITGGWVCTRTIPSLG